VEIKEPNYTEYYEQFVSAGVKTNDDDEDEDEIQ
jgi:hypothetical protein